MNKPKYKRIQELTEQEVQEIFRQRANGSSYDALKNTFNISDPTISDIINHGARPDVKIPSDVVDQVAVQRYKRKPAPNKPTQKITLDQALAGYTSAAIHLQETRALCADLGVNSDTLDLLREAVRNGA